MKACFISFDYKAFKNIFIDTFKKQKGRSKFRNLNFLEFIGIKFETDQCDENDH